MFPSMIGRSLKKSGRIIPEFLEPNDNGNTTYQNLYNIAEIVLKCL